MEDTALSLTGIAAQMGTTTSSLEELLTGAVPVGVAARLGTTTSSLQDFLNGGTSIGLAARIGTTSSAVQDLRNVIGDQGAIGLLIGLCISAGR